MTDEQIIKALECCANSKCVGCLFNDGFADCIECTTELAKNALFIISRQIGEIEQLKQDVADLEETNGYLFAEFERMNRNDGCGNH